MRQRCTDVRFWTGVLAVLSLLALCPPARADDYDRWYAIEMGGQRAGWMHTLQVTAPEGIRTSNEVSFQIGRAQAALAISIAASFVETAAGKPVAMDATLRLGKTPTVMHAQYGGDGIAVDLTQSGETTHSTRPLPEGTWLTPAAATEYVRQRLAAGAEKIVVTTVDPGGGVDPASMLRPATITHSDCREATVEALGKPVKVTRCITTSSAQPGIESVEYLDAGGVPVRSETSFGGIRMVAVVVSKAEALAAHAGPELMVSSFVKPDRRIEGARGTRRAVYTLSIAEGKMPALPSTAAQRFEGDGERGGRLTVDAGHPAPADAADAGDASFTAPSPMIDSANEKVRALSAQATEGLRPDKSARAEAMRRFVHGYITAKDLGVGFATASETAVTRQGDCTEHAVLLAALLRVDGIPSRVACGLVYADRFAGASDIFGYHMWTQALLERDGKPAWVDLDATLSEARPFDATHIALAVSALGDGQSQDALLAIAAIIGRLKIKVESVEQGK